MKRVMVIGDVILDEYTYSSPLGISAETPTVVAELKDKRMFIGGAGLVTRHLLRLGCQVILHTVGESGVDLKKLFLESADPPSSEEMDRLTIIPFHADGWKLTRKIRHFVNDYKLLQHDVLNRGRHDRKSTESFIFFARMQMSNLDAVVLADNRHGVLTGDLASTLIANLRAESIPSYVDSQVSQNTSNLSDYFGADYFFVNERELRSFVIYDEPLEKCARLATGELDGKVIVKLGSAGAAELDDNGMFVTYPPPKVKAIDTCGAGDAFLAAYVAHDRDIMVANRWAALSTTYKGTIVPRLEDDKTLPR